MPRLRSTLYTPFYTSIGIVIASRKVLAIGNLEATTNLSIPILVFMALAVEFSIGLVELQT
ncbi:hypothetical protein E4U33_000398 [Claviceps sp. LM78 group G4]|nr:hypothetical protein E4U33_000398 [Claviceps sp. LM78 group G4]